MRLLIIASMLWLTSCSYFFEEKNEKNSQVSFDLGEKSGCLADFFDIQFSYIAGEIPLQAALANTDCVQETLASINKIIVGDEVADKVSQEEVYILLNELFFKEKPLSFLLVDHAITMKSWLVGGFEDELTKSEIAKVISLLGHWKTFLKKTEPYLPALHWESGEGTEEEFETAFAEVRIHLEEFLDEFPEKIEPFSIDVVKVFVEELRAHQGESSLASFVDLFHGMVWLINGSDDVVVLKNTVVAFYEFLHSYRRYNYLFESSLVEVIDRPDVFLIWLDETIGRISELLEDDYVLPLEGLELIVQFLADYLNT